MQSTTATPFAATRLSLRIHKDPPEPEKDKIRKSFFFKTVFQKMNRQGTYLENIFTMHISDQTLISRTYKELLLLNNRKTNSPIKCGKKFGVFTREDKQIINKYMKKYITLVITEMKIKTTIIKTPIQYTNAYIWNLERW